MKYVYLLQSISHPEKRYIGLTEDIINRLDAHNNGKSFHTAKFRPWRIILFIQFEDDTKAIEFEKYLETGSGWAFANKHFW
jgi:putative endonuclease